MSCVVYVSSDQHLAELLPWALRMAASQGNTLSLIFARSTMSADQSVVELDWEQKSHHANDSAQSDWLAELRGTLDRVLGATSWGVQVASSDEGQTTAGVDGLAVRVSLVPREMDTTKLLKVLDAADPDLVLLVYRRLDREDSEQAGQRRSLLHGIPQPCVVLRPGAGDGGESVAGKGAGRPEADHILAGFTGSRNARASLRLAAQLCGQDFGLLTALYVEADIGRDAQAVGEHRLKRLVSKVLGRKAAELKQWVLVDNRPEAGLAEAIEELQPGLVMLGMAHHGGLAQRLRGSVGQRLLKANRETSIAVVRAAKPIRLRLHDRLGTWLGERVPQLEREHRIDLVERVESDAAWDFDFFALMLLSTTIAALGLIQNSLAVVIGAMLVAPLMMPLLGLGLAVVQGNGRLAQRAGRAVVLGFITAYLLGILVGWLVPSYQQPSAEMLARDWPDSIDLWVAFISGLAAAYAASRPGLLAALPGVAIAAALVPPLATSGLATGIGEYDLALGALLLFLTNGVAIVFASAISLWVVGIRRGKPLSGWSRVLTTLLYSAVIVLSLWLGFR